MASQITAPKWTLEDEHQADTSTSTRTNNNNDNQPTTSSTLTAAEAEMARTATNEDSNNTTNEKAAPVNMAQLPTSITNTHPQPNLTLKSLLTEKRNHKTMIPNTIAEATRNELTKNVHLWPLKVEDEHQTDTSTSTRTNNKNDNQPTTSSTLTAAEAEMATTAKRTRKTGKNAFSSPLITAEELLLQTPNTIAEATRNELTKNSHLWTLTVETTETMSAAEAVNKKIHRIKKAEKEARKLGTHAATETIINEVAEEVARITMLKNNIWMQLSPNVEIAWQALLNLITEHMKNRLTTKILYKPNIWEKADNILQQIWNFYLPGIKELVAKNVAFREINKITTPLPTTNIGNQTQSTANKISLMTKIAMETLTTAVEEYNPLNQTSPNVQIQTTLPMRLIMIIKQKAAMITKKISNQKDIANQTTSNINFLTFQVKHCKISDHKSLTKRKAITNPNNNLKRINTKLLAPNLETWPPAPSITLKTNDNTNTDINNEPTFPSSSNHQQLWNEHTFKSGSNTIFNKNSESTTKKYQPYGYQHHHNL